MAAGDVQRVNYRIGPFKVIPGQNEIGATPIRERPQVDGYITRIKPDLIYTNGKVPGVDVIHLHHGVWVNLSRSNATHSHLRGSQPPPARCTRCNRKRRSARRYASPP
jgi:hypothetical protein